MVSVVIGVAAIDIPDLASLNSVALHNGMVRLDLVNHLHNVVIGIPVM